MILLNVSWLNNLGFILFLFFIKSRIRSPESFLTNTRFPLFFRKNMLAWNSDQESASQQTNGIFRWVFWQMAFFLCSQAVGSEFPSWKDKAFQIFLKICFAVLRKAHPLRFGVCVLFCFVLLALTLQALQEWTWILF